MSSFPAHDQFSNQPQQPAPARHGFFSRRPRPQQDQELQDIEVSPFINQQGRDISPVRTLPTSTAYQAGRYMPEDLAHAKGHATQSSYPVSSSFEKMNEPYPEPVYIEPRKPGIRQRYRGFFELLQGVLIFVFVGLILSIPVFVTADARESGEGDTQQKQTRNLIYYVFLLLLTTWGMTGCAYLIAIVLPYVFRFVAHFINPAHKKYWRVFVMLRRPFTILLGVVSGYISLVIWFITNDQISSFNNNGVSADDPDADYSVSQLEFANTVATIMRILLYFMFWAAAYFLEKVLMSYLTIHYHYRANHAEIQRSKKMNEVLAELFKYSNRLYPKGHTLFAVEDHVIYAARQAEDGQRHLGSSTAAFLDKISGNFVQAFGIVFGSDSKTHWLSPRSTYAVVNRALEHPASSAALAKRIWVSLTSEGSTVLTADDVAAAFGPKQSKKAMEYFKVLDENENGDIRLDELIPTVVETGIKRENIYAGMANLAHVVNTLDWISVGWLAMIMLGLVLISEIDLLKQIKDVIGFAALGLSFVVGRTFNEIVQGAIFTILDHPYDLGDVVEIYTLNEGKRVLLTVKRISLLYTVFTEVGNGKQVQYTNMRSKIKRISNLSRSGKNREAIVFNVDFKTTFAELELLKGELQDFVTAPENSRDFYPDVALRVTSVNDLNRLELRVSFLHKANWSNDGLRAARSSRFHCALVAAIRRVPISKPGGIGLGNEANPQYMVHINDGEATSKKSSLESVAASKRMDFVAPDPADETLSDEEKAEKAAAAKLEKAQAEVSARSQIMGIKSDMSERNNAFSSSIELRDNDGASRFAFVSGVERGARPNRGPPQEV